MAAGNEVAGIDIVARLDGFRAEMAKVKDIGADEVRALTQKLSKEIKAAEKAARDAGKAANDSKKQVKGWGDAAGDAGQSAKKLRGALALLGPEAVAMAGMIDDAGDAVEVFAKGAALLSPIAIGLTLAIGAGAVAYSQYTDSVEKAEAALKKQQATAEQQLAIERAMSDAFLKNAVLRGDMTDAEYAAISAATKADEVFKARKSALIEEIQKEQAALTALTTAQATFHEGAEIAAGKVDVLTGVYQAYGASVREVEAATGDAVSGVAEHKAKLEELGTQLGEVTLAEQEYVRLLKENETLEDLAGEAAARREFVFASLLEAREHEADRVREITVGIGRLLQVAEDAEAAQLTGVDKVIDARDRAITKIGEETSALLLQSKSEGERAAIVIAAEEAVTAETVKAHHEIEEIRRKAHDDELKRIEERRQKQLDAATETMAKTAELAGHIGDAIQTTYERQADTVVRLGEYLEAADEHLTDAQKEQIQARMEATKKAARRSFELAKLANMGKAAMNTAEAITEALPNIPLAVVVGALGAIEIGAIATTSPAFHSGGTRDGLQPDETMSRTLPGEAWLSRTGRKNIGDERIHDANADIPPAPQRLTVDQYYNHRLADRGVSKTIDRGGRLQRSVAGLTKTTPTGHRSR